MELVEQKKDQLDSMLRLQNYLLECAEIKSQIQDKRKAIDATQYMGSDLGGVLALQRRLSTMEGALSVLEPKLLHLQVGNYRKIDSCTVGIYSLSHSFLIRSECEEPQKIQKDEDGFIRRLYCAA